MQVKKQEILEAAGRIILLSGTQALTLPALAKKLKVEVNELAPHIHNEERIFELLLLQLEKELKELIREVSSNAKLSTEELELFFKKLHGLFKQKPYYLIIIFDEDLHQRFRKTLRTILNIERTAKNYLTGVIKQGKQEKIFTTVVSTKVLVDNILGSFQALMNDIQIADKIVLNLKRFQPINN